MAGSWFNGNGVERSQLRKKMDEDQIGNSSKDDEERYNEMYVGDAALRLMSGVATRKDVGTVVGQMIVDCEMDIRREVTTFLSECDASSTVAKDAHFRARVSAAMLHRLNGYITDSKRAAEALIDRSE